MLSELFSPDHIKDHEQRIRNTIDAHIDAASQLAKSVGIDTASIKALRASIRAQPCDTTKIESLAKEWMQSFVAGIQYRNSTEGDSGQ